jgi:hypothetical protein
VLFTLGRDGHVRGDYDSLKPFLARFLARRHLHMAHRAAMIKPHLIRLTSSNGDPHCRLTASNCGCTSCEAFGVDSGLSPHGISTAN